MNVHSSFQCFLKALRSDDFRRTRWVACRLFHTLQCLKLILQILTATTFAPKMSVVARSDKIPLFPSARFDLFNQVEKMISVRSRITAASLGWSFHLSYAPGIYLVPGINLPSIYLSLGRLIPGTRFDLILGSIRVLIFWDTSILADIQWLCTYRVGMIREPVARVRHQPQLVCGTPS